MAGKFQRPTSYMERVWLCMDGCYPPYCNQVVLEGEGDLDAAKLQSAVDKASEVNPGSRLVLKGVLRKCYWQDTGLSPRVRLINDCRWDGRSSDNAPFLQTRLPYWGPTCEVVYAKGDVSRLIFRSNHAVMDGMGTLTWMDDVFRILRGEEPLGSTSALNEKALASTLTNQTQKPAKADCIAPTGKVAKFEKGATWKRLSFTGPHSQLMGKVAHALARSAWKYGDGLFRVVVSSDIRKRAPEVVKRCTGNLTIGITVEITPESTPETITQDIKNQLANKNDLVMVEGRGYMDLIPIWMLQTGMNVATRLAFKEAKYQMPALISNLGLVDMQRYCGGSFTTENIFLIPPRMDVLPAFVVLTGSAKGLEVTVSVPNALAGEGRMDRLLDDIRAAIE